MSKSRHPRQYDPALPQLRRRTSLLVRDCPKSARAFVRLLPLLFNARFRRPGLDKDPCGVRLAPRRRRWGTLCAQLDLTTPIAYAAKRPLVQAIVLAPRVGGGFEVLVVPVVDCTPADGARLTAQVQAVAALAERFAPGFEVRLASRAELTTALLPWAAVCAGELPPFREGPLERLEFVLRAPTALTRCLALLVPPTAPPVLDTLRQRPGPTSPLAFLARWADDETLRAVAAGSNSTVAALIDAGTRLRSACTRALRALPARERRPLHAALRRELFTSRLPAALRPALEAFAHGAAVSERRVPGGWALLLHGVELARARTLDQLRASAVAESPLLARPDGPWERVAKVHAAAQPRLLVVVEAGSVSHLAITVTRRGRPRARRVDGPALLRLVLATRARGLGCEVISSRGSDQALVVRLAQLAALPSQGAVAVEVADRLVVADGARVRSLPFRTALARPRTLAFLPTEHDLARSLRPTGASLVPTTQAVAWPLSEASVAVFFSDRSGTLLREEVPLAALEAHLVDSRELARQAEASELLSVTVHPLLVALAGRRLDTALQVVPLDVDCEWPFTLRVWLEGEAFCAPGDLSWSALAEAVLSRWTPGTWGRVSVRQVRFIRPPPTSSALHLLAIRSRVLRRLAIALRRVTRVLEAA